MRLYHASEEDNINIFIPRLPNRNDLNPNIGLVWAINERCLPNYLLPRDCPRVCYHLNHQTSNKDIEKYIGKEDINHVIYVEDIWLDIIKKTTIFIYEFNDRHFELQDDIAGYYISKEIEKPINKIIVNDLLSELKKRNVELRVVDKLDMISAEIIQSTFNWSLCRMRNAKK